MYTKCPSCRSEISFEPPANMDSLPEGYKHRIKCPSCGVTIGVKIPKQEAAPLSFTPQNEFAKNDDYVIPTAQPVERVSDAAPAATKKSGTARNIFMMIFSLLLIAVNVVAYLVESGKFQIPEVLAGLTWFDGIIVFDGLINDFDIVKVIFTKDSIVEAIIFLLPAFLFVLAGIQFIVAFIAAIGKKYSRAFNFIFALFIAASAFVILFQLLIADTEIGFVNYVKGIVEDKYYGLIVGAGIALLDLIFAFVGALIPMKKKN